MTLLPWILAARMCLPPTPEAVVRNMAVAEGIDPDYAACIVTRESEWDIEAVGDGGEAVGL